MVMQINDGNADSNSNSRDNGNHFKVPGCLT